jgi:hypothetical protein
VPDRWSRGVRVRKGNLTRYGWHARNDSDSRHAAIRRAVEAHGEATVSQELGFIANVAGESDAREKEAAGADRRWLAREHREGNL